MQKSIKIVSFDFDNTLVQGFLQQFFFSNESNPQQLYDRDDAWQSIIQQIIHKISKQSSTSQLNIQKYLQSIKQLQINKGFKQLLQKLINNGYQLIIVSGGNKLFIKEFLKLKQLDEYFSAILANDLQYTNFTWQYKPQDIKCQFQHCDSPCKKILIQRYIQQKTNILRKQNMQISIQLFHIGDGVNDFCPLKLSYCSTSFIRKWYGLNYMLQDKPKLKQQIKGKVNTWQNGYDIIKLINFIN